MRGGVSGGVVQLRKGAGGGGTGGGVPKGSHGKGLVSVRVSVGRGVFESTFEG